MANIAIVENEQEAVNRLTECLERYARENNVPIKKTVFINGEEFLESYQPVYDIVFMDVDMPKINGFKAAKKLREIDQKVILVFVTNLSRYAIRGYEYNATDYILKPLEYASFSLKLDRILSLCRTSQSVRLQESPDKMFMLDVSEIYYVEIKKHAIIYHTARGDITGYGTMKKVEEELPRELFYRCNNCYLVNLQHVKSVDGFDVSIGGDTIRVSHPKKKGFLDALHSYYMGV